MRFSTLLLSVATVGTTTLAFAIAAPASAQEQYPHKQYTHTHYAHAHYRHYAHYPPGRQIVVHPQQPALVQPVQAQTYTWGPVAAVGNVVGGTGQAVQGVFTGAGAVVGGVLGGVLGGVSALFGYPPSYAYGATFAAPFNATGAVAATPFQSVSGAFGAPPPAQPAY
jgi:hypothetical protein